MTMDDKLIILKRIFWDYHDGSLPIVKAARGEFDSIGDYEFKIILNRMFERLNWYDLMDILGVDRIIKFLTKDNISRIRFSELRDRYEFIRKVLSGEPVSFAGWGDAYRQKIRHTLFSDRWYRS